MNNVVTLFMGIKDTYIQFRVKDEIKEDLRIVAELRGLSVSALLHSMATRTIREEKEREPQAFRRSITPTVGVRQTKAKDLGEISDKPTIKKRRAG